MKEFVDYLFNNIGNCLICMRKSFQTAAASWLLSAALGLLGNELVTGMALILAFALSLLWITHLTAYASRNSLSPVGRHTLSNPAHLFFQNLAYAVGETAVLYRSSPKDRFGRSLFGRSYLIELKNADGSWTAYRKNQYDVRALVLELESRGYTGEMTDPEYWLSTDSCERSAASGCKNHTCDVSTKTCKGTGGMGACRCT